MRRTTTIFIAGWIGFLAISSLTGIFALFSVADLGIGPIAVLDPQIQHIAALIRAGGNAAALVVMAESLATLMTLSFMAAAGWLLLRSSDDDRLAGERFALLAFGFVGALYTVSYALAAPVLSNAGTPFAFGFVIAASMLAVVLDRLSSVEKPEDDEQEFRAALMLIGQQMAREPLRIDRTPKEGSR